MLNIEKDSKIRQKAIQSKKNNVDNLFIVTNSFIFRNLFKILTKFIIMKFLEILY